jgi:hypothetical protein
MLAALLIRAAQAVRSGLIKDAIDLGLLAAHLREFNSGIDQQRFDDALNEEWHDTAIAESLQSGPYQARWDAITANAPHISRHEVTELEESREVA